LVIGTSTAKLEREYEGNEKWEQKLETERERADMVRVRREEEEVTMK